MQKILDVALHDLFVGIQNAKETFPAALLKELFFSAGTFPSAQHSKHPLPAQDVPGTTNPPHLCHPGQGANPH